MKIGFVVTAHQSEEFRPKGLVYLERFLKSVENFCKYNYMIYVVDNGSTDAIQLEAPKTTYIRIEDQTVGGITGAWNDGIYYAYNDGCDIIINCNDDLYFNETINILIRFILNTNDVNAVYSGLSNGILQGTQRCDKPKKGIQRLTSPNNVLNGFCFAMTRQHYEKFRFMPDKYFNVNNKYNEGDGKWGGQEGQFAENLERGSYGIVVNECFIPHTKVRGWKKLKNKYKK